MNKPFPFWRLALSIATGMVIANAVTWFAAETRLRYEMHQLAREAEQSLAKAQRERTIRAQAKAAEEARRDRAQREARAAVEAREAKAAAESRARIERDQLEGEYFPLAADDLPLGTFACLDRKIVKRTATGWELATLGDGSAARCRTEP